MSSVHGSSVLTVKQDSPFYKLSKFNKYFFYKHTRHGLVETFSKDFTTHSEGKKLGASRISPLDPMTLSEL